MAEAIFDRRLVRQRRDRAVQTLAAHDFLLDEAASRLADRLSDVRRRFDVAADLGCRTGLMARHLPADAVGRLIQMDLSPGMVAAAGGDLVGDDEILPFADGSLDLVLSCWNLHWVNDLPGTLTQIRRALKPDGIFLAVMPGGDTLIELRNAWLRAESALSGGAGPRVSPFATLYDMAGLLQRAGFALPMADLDRVTVTYDNPLKLHADLRGMGEGNALAARPGPANLDLVAAVAGAYGEAFADDEGRVPATFEMIFLTGWAPAPSQPQPLAPGSGKTSLADVLTPKE